MKPKVKLRLNKPLDKKMAFEFSTTKQGGVDFSRGIVSVHPKLKNVRKIGDDEKKRERINSYFDLFYRKHGAYLRRRKGEFAEEWGEIEEKFLLETKKIFKDHSFPGGKYIGYISIVDCNPRFLEDKTFQVFYLHPCGVKYITAHELLHFIFYDYAIKKYPKLFEGLDTESGIFWDIAEVFNSIALHTPSFVRIHEIKKRVAYPEHQRYLPELDRMWQECQDVDRLITEVYQLVALKHPLLPPGLRRLF